MQFGRFNGGAPMVVAYNISSMWPVAKSPERKATMYGTMSRSANLRSIEDRTCSENGSGPDDTCPSLTDRDELTVGED